MKKNKYVLELESRLQTIIAANQALNGVIGRKESENKMLLSRMAELTKEYTLSVSRERECKTTIKTLIRMLKVSEEEDIQYNGMYKSTLPIEA